LGVLSETAAELCSVDAAAARWPIVFEFELPLEGGRRPDVVVLAGESVIVLEFKMTERASPADIDQVTAYARDLGEYHAGSHDPPVWPVLVATRSQVEPRDVDRVVEVGPGDLAEVIRQRARPGSIDLDTWLHSDYQPLPQLVHAAQRIFEHEHLPHVRRAESAGIPEAVASLASAAEQARAEGRRALALVAGVPGAGKTLVGLRVVYEECGDDADSVFLSGNGPLVQVLQHALGSGVFVKDLHKVVLDYGKRGRLPRQHILVFDEAQRAWDRERVLAKRQIDASEPDLLIQIGERVDDWCLIVGLIGEGQEIYAGEEGGLEQWAEAIGAPNASHDWQVICPPRLAELFDSAPQRIVPELDLTVSLRSRRAEMLHEFVAAILAGELDSAAEHAAQIHHGGFPLRIGRDLDQIAEHAVARFAGEPDRRYGLVASSHAKNLEGNGVANGFMATSRMKIGPWFNNDQSDPLSCCALDQPVTEFGCQGLELDLPVVCWGDDMTWSETGWNLRPVRRRDPIDSPEELLLNAYRVLLTRGRDGLMVFVPPDTAMNDTFTALNRAGSRSLP